MSTYNKLVRDKIPEILDKKGVTYEKRNSSNTICAIVFILAIIFITQTRLVFACTPLYLTAEEIFKKSDAVFLGRVLSVTSPETQGDVREVNGEVQVEKYWKGKVGSLVKIKSTGIYTCGTAFSEHAKGGTYLIYATKPSGASDAYTVGMVDMKLASTSMFEIQTLGTGFVPNVGPSGSQFTKNLTVGSSGDDVARLQTWLVQKGFLVMPAGVSKGYFGNLTRTALAQYQISAGITPAVGYFGPITRTKINAQF
jgi:hypothetical protein